MVLYGKYPLEMEVLYGFMGKSWEYMGIASGKLLHILKMTIEIVDYNQLID